MCVLFINRLGFNVTGGEEQYLAFARQFVNPDWIPGSFTYTEFAGTRIVFQWLVGPVMEWLSFEQAVFWLRALNFAFIAIPMAYFFRAIRFPVLLTFIVVQVFVVQGVNSLKHSLKRLNPDPDFLAMCAYISQHTERDASFLLLHPNNTNHNYNAFGRRAERENFVAPKFVASERHKLLEWYLRIRTYNAVHGDLANLKQTEVNYLLTSEAASEPFLSLVREEGVFKLYRIVAKKAP